MKSTDVHSSDQIQVFFLKLFPGYFFRRPTEFGIMFFRHLECVSFATTFLCVFFPPIQKMLHVKVASHVFRQSSKVTLSKKKSFKHRHIIYLQIVLLEISTRICRQRIKEKNDDVRTNPMTLQTKQHFFPEISPGHGCHVPACASSIQGVLSG